MASTTSTFQVGDIVTIRHALRNAHIGQTGEIVDVTPSNPMAPYVVRFPAGDKARFRGTWLARQTSTSNAPSQVVSDWVEHVDPSTQQRFFYSASQRRSSWTDHSIAAELARQAALPEPAQEPKVDVQTGAIASDWEAHEDPQTKQTFFYSAALRRSSWTDHRVAAPQPADPVVPLATATGSTTPAGQLPSLTPATLAPVASDWIEQFDPATQKNFYYSASQRRATWTDRRFELNGVPQAVIDTMPAATGKAQDPLQQVHDWTAQVDAQSGRHFYYSASQRRSTWTNPFVQIPLA